MSSLKWFIKSVWEHIQDAGKDFKQFPKDIEDSVRNWILRQPQTLRDYNITTDLPQQELLDTLSGFHTSSIQNIKTWIAERLLLTMDRKNFPINVRKMENIYWEITTIEDLYKYEGTEIINNIQKLLNEYKIAPQKQETIEKIKEIFRASSNNALKTTKSKILDWLNQLEASYTDKDWNNWIDQKIKEHEMKSILKTIDEVYELIAYKFAIRIYQFFNHYDRGKNENHEETLKTATDFFEQAKDFSLEQSKAYTKQKLTPQDIFSLQIYNYNSNFWNTHIKDGNDIKDLILFKPHVPRPPKPDNEPKLPKKSDFDNVEDYEQALNEYQREFKQRKKTPEYKKRNEWTEKTEWMKDILKAVLDLWPLNRLSNGVIKRISAVLERWWWAWVQHLIEARYRPNILQMSPEEEELLRHILIDVKYGKKCFITLNHETFANIPITIVKFMQVAHEMWIENANEYFTTIIWPLLATHKKQNALLNSLSSILVTHPADNRILWAKRISNHQQQNAGSQFEKDLTKQSPKWQIYFCAPSWTRDVVHYWDDWVPQIFIPDATWGSNITTGKLIRALHRENPDLKIYAVSTNTTALKRPNPEEKVLLNNNRWNPNATVSMHLQEIDKNDLSTENIISTILRGITYPIPSWETRKPSRNIIKRRRNKWKLYYDYDENGKINEVPCAIAIPPIIFQYLKSFTKTKEYAKTWKLPNKFFNQDWKLNFDSEEFRLLQDFSKTSEYKKIRKIPSRLFDEKWFIELDVLKAEMYKKSA